MPVVRDIMTHRPTAIRATAPARAALATMMELDVRHLPVVNEARELIGMVSDRDFRALPIFNPGVEELVGDGRVRVDEPIANLMSSDVISVEPDDDMLEVVELMLEHRIGAVPVVQANGHLVGIVSYIDVLKQIKRDAG